MANTGITTEFLPIFVSHFSYDFLDFLFVLSFSSLFLAFLHVRTRCIGRAQGRRAWI